MVALENKQARIEARRPVGTRLHPEDRMKTYTKEEQMDLGRRMGIGEIYLRDKFSRSWSCVLRMKEEMKSREESRKLPRCQTCKTLFNLFINLFNQVLLT
jgi:hypothetical protein